MACQVGPIQGICDQGGSVAPEQSVVAIPVEWASVAAVVRSYSDGNEFRRALIASIRPAYNDYRQIMDILIRHRADKQDSEMPEKYRASRTRDTLVKGITRFMGVDDNPATAYLRKVIDEAVSDEIRPGFRSAPQIADYIQENMPAYLQRLLFTEAQWGGMPPVELQHFRVEKALQNGVAVPMDVVARYPDLIEKYGL